jgi:signal transduction histidine kinase/CheY-like chemotaxis protein
VVGLRWRRAAPAGAHRAKGAAATELARQEVQRPSASVDELVRLQAALAETRAGLASARAESQRARAEAGAMLRQRHSFVAGLAHDLRNPLAPLSNGIELLRMTDEDAAGRLRTRGIMERQIGHLMRIADELSDLARLTGDQATLQHLPFQPGLVLKAVADATRTALQAQEITLEAEVDPPGPLPMLQGDAQRLEQALSHLVRDLARHAERGTTLRMIASAAGTEVTIVVAAAQDLHPRAAGPASPRLGEAGPGALGLGIALAEQIVELHGGRLQVQRPAGMRRARFAVTLPVAQAQDDASASADEPEPALALSPEPALAILLADDDEEFSSSFGTMLELLGHRVTVVHDGLAAVAAIAGAPTDIAFIDLGMPSLDGYDAVQRVRGRAQGGAVLLVAITGRGGAEDRARAAECGFDRYLVKPFAMQDVRDALDAAQAVRAEAALASSRELA